jgi:hypothetical protein
MTANRTLPSTHYRAMCLRMWQRLLQSGRRWLTLAKPPRPMRAASESDSESVSAVNAGRGKLPQSAGGHPAGGKRPPLVEDSGGRAE